MTDRQKLKKLYSLLEEIDAYGRCVGKVQFDLECCAPEEGMAQAGEDMAILGKRIHALTHSKQLVRLVTELHESHEGLTPVEVKAVDYLYEDWQKEKNITAAFAYERDRIFSKAYGDWLSAKKANDYSLFRDTFASVVECTRKTIDLRDRKYSTYYAACLDDTEKGGSEEQLDAFFESLKAEIIPFLKKIQAEGKPIRTDFLTRPCPIPQQEAFSRYLLKLEGLRESALVLMTTEHPFTDNFGPHDVRVTTHYYENNFFSNIFSTLHEGGHAIFMQNEPEEFVRCHTDNRMSNAMHECISRFYENIIGRSREFISLVYPKLQEISGDIFADVTGEELYRAANLVEPNLIRCDADELTYCLHIIVRYELEKEFVNGNITVDEIPELWNKKYKEYLGLDVPDYTSGCLQDVHWTMSYGYFPSYALGNAYGAQIFNTMLKDFDVYAAVKAGELDRIRDWLKEHVFSIASITDPDEWIKTITGESLNVRYYLDYMKAKLSEVYGLDA